ncbi:MAG TPA: sensor histidine kinase [Lacipirellulaceae bacterium]|jgi:signal transduction histidine kinase|nr:sensor histidine kinase [Lacipirellulaceae bacterium]
MSVVSLRRIGALIREQRHILLARWRRQVRQLPSARELDTPSLNDHMPYLIDELADALEAQPDDVAEELLLQGSPPAHGRQRLHDGFNVEEVVAEYNVLRSCVHDLAEEHGIVIHGNDLRVVNRIIDEAIGLAVQTYATQLSLEIKKHRDEHIAFVAHDLQTPLQAISLTVRMIEQTVAASGTGAPTEKLLKILRRNVEQLEKSVIDVIKTSGASAEDSEKLERREVDLWPIVESVMTELQPIISASSVELVNNVPAELRVFADAGLLTRALENAVAFAVNSAPRGIVRVEAADAGTAGVCCEIHHNGAPPSPDTMSTLFDQGTDAQHGPDGIGLSLAIVKRVIEAHCGEAHVRTSDEPTTTIEFRLPSKK